MSPEMGRRLTLLLVITLILQVWTLMRQAGLESQLEQVVAQQTSLRQQVHGDINSLGQQIRAIAEADRWISRPEVAVDPAADCRGAAVTVTWQLLQWTEGTTARLQYRRRGDESWQEARVQALGGQSYAATFAVTGSPELRPQVEIAYRNQNGRNQGAAARAVEATAGGPPLQYRILAEGPGMNRGTAVESLFLDKVFARPLKVTVVVGPGSQFEVVVPLPAGESGGCLAVTGGAVRTYAGDQLVSTVTLAPEQWGTGGTTLLARWQEPQPPGRLVINLETAGGERMEVPVALSGR